MSHTALARKHRPLRFSDVATQEHVSETLRRAVMGDRVGHAYLFCGPRGVGKTTLARVLAMALNCAERSSEGEPCGECDTCRRIWAGQTALDVVEIDAASNRGVDDARDLRERAMYAPSAEGRFKVYIVDEAHMLTREAWNALLKILEEPPPRVIFVFATTEPQKIQQFAAPILSRCQRFDFRRIGVSDIVARLTTVLEREGLAAPEDALRVLARRADGGMRDALSLLDQVLALTGGELTLESARLVLGLVPEERYVELFDILRESRHGDVFRFVEGLLDEGYDLVEFYHGLVSAIRTTLRGALDGDLTDLEGDLKEAFLARARAFAPADLVRMLAMASDVEISGSLRRSTNPQMVLEMLLLRLSFLDGTVELQELIRSLGGAPAPAPELAPAPESAPEPVLSAVPAASETGTQDDQPPAAEVDPPPVDPKPVSVPEASEPQQAPLALEDAWAQLLKGGGAVPAGLTPLLRAARIEEESNGRVVLHVPEGPVRERLSGGGDRARIQDELSRLVGREIDLTLAEVNGGEADGGRITPEKVSSDRMKELVQKEPLLERAVLELDLELLE